METDKFNKIYDETMMYFKINNLELVDNLPFLHFRLDNPDLPVEEAIKMFKEHEYTNKN